MAITFRKILPDFVFVPSTAGLSELSAGVGSLGAGKFGFVELSDGAALSLCSGMLVPGIGLELGLEEFVLLEELGLSLFVEELGVLASGLGEP